MAMIASSFSIPFLLILFICITITFSIYCDSTMASDTETPAITQLSGSNTSSEDENASTVDPSGSNVSSDDNTTPATDHSDSNTPSDHDKNTPTTILLVKTNCESWRMNVELHNIHGFRHIPGECINYISNYMTTQYKADVRRATEEATVFLNNLQHSSDYLDAWIFDVDDTLLSTLPYYEKNHFVNKACGEETPALLETWMKEAEVPAVDYMLDLFNKIKERGFKILLISSRKEHLTGVTVNSLMKAGYHGWDQLKLRCPTDDDYSIEEYKAKQRKRFKEEGYRLCGNIGDQWSSLNGDPYATRSFKLPNPMYYQA